MDAVQRRTRPRARAVQRGRRSRRSTAAVGTCSRRSGWRSPSCLSDAFAFGALARAEALVPGGVLFVFIAALGADRLRVELSVRCSSAPVSSPRSSLRAHHAPGGIRTRRVAPHRGSLTAGRRRVAARRRAPRRIRRRALPGSRVGTAVRHPRRRRRRQRRSEPARRHPVSRLTNQRNVRDDRRHGERPSRTGDATTLADFDGEIWRAADRDDRCTGPRSRSPPDRRTRQIRQQVRIVGLGGTHGAGGAGSVRAGPDASCFDESARRRCRPPTRSCRGATASTSSPPRRASIRRSWPRRPRSRRPTTSTSTSPTTSRPAPLQPAEEVTAGAANNYETALSSSRTGSRSNSGTACEVQPGHGNNAIEGFLRDRVGYCEQFAGTYAAMMRSLGIPARVAVGFTTGQATGTGYSVDRPQRSRVARGVVRRPRLGAVRTDPWPWCTGHRELHGRR